MDFSKQFDYIDTHCHLDLYKNYTEVIAQSKVSNTSIVAVTNLPSVFERECKLFKDYSNVIVALGFHPQLVKSHGDQVSQMLSFMSKTQFIGEIGLDYQENNDDLKTKQKYIFKRILDNAATYGNKILSVHSRKSSEDVVAMIGSNFPGSIILHWYSGSQSTLKKALSNGYLFSVNPAMTFSASGRSIINGLPLEKILTETDGPFTEVNNKQSIPSDVNLVLDYLAKLHNQTTQNIKEIIKNNFLNILN